MKYLIFIMLTLFAENLFLSNDSNGYDELWAKVTEFESKQLPQSAYEIVENIYAKAVKDKEDSQLIKAIIFKAKLSSQFEDKDPAEFISLFEDELTQLTSPESVAVYNSILGELYQRYGIMNMSRYSNRTELESGDTKYPIELLSLEEIQSRSIEYYLQSLELRSNQSIDSFSILINKQEARGNVINALTVEEFVLFRALNHFINDQSFVSLPKENFELTDTKYFGGVDDFVEINLDSKNHQNYDFLAIKLFQRALELSINNDSQLILIDLERLEFLNRKMNIQDKEIYYVHFLEDIITGNQENPTIQLAYSKLIEYYINRGEKYRFEFDQEYKKDCDIAYQWIQKCKRQINSGPYNYIIENQQLKLNSKFLKIELEQVQPASTDFLAYVKYRNIGNLFFRICRLTDDQWEEYRKQRDAASKINYVKSLDQIRAWNIDIDQQNDFNYHATEIPIEGLAYGRYVLMAANDPKFDHGTTKTVNLGVFTISDLTYIHNNRQSFTEVIVLDRNTGNVVDNAQVEIFAQEYNYSTRRNEWSLVYSQLTNDEGYVRYNQAQRNFRFRISKGQDILDLNHGHFNVKERDFNRRSRVHLFTDRAIYRPGQTIFFKGLLSQTDEAQIPSILPEQRIEVVFRDVNWEVIEERSFTTNAYGTINGFFIAPKNVLTGLMTIECKSSNGFSSYQIRVEEYKRPKIYAQLDTLKNAYVLGDTIDVSGELKSFSGAMMQGAKLRYKVTKQEYMPWYRIRDYGYSRPGTSHTLAFIGSGESYTNQEGKFSFSFPTKADLKKHRRFFNYNIECELIDITGETVIITKTINLNNTPFNFNVRIDTYQFEGKIDEFDLKTVNCEGKKLEGSVAMEVFELSYPTNVYRSKYWAKNDWDYINAETYEKRFPLDGNDQHLNPDNWKVGKRILTSELSSNQTHINDLAALSPGAYKINFKVEDEHGNQLELPKNLFISGYTGKALELNNLWVSNPLDSYEPGDDFQLDVNTPYEDYRIFYRVSQNNKEIERQWLESNDKSIHFRIQEEHRGGFGIELVFVIDNRIYKENINVSVPWSNKDLKLSYSTFRNKLEPGIKENWRIKFSTLNEKFDNAEVLASMYDLSLDQFVSSNWERTFYPSYTNNLSWNGIGFSKVATYSYVKNLYNPYSVYLNGFGPHLNWFEFYLSSPMRMNAYSTVRKSAVMDGAVPRTTEPELQDQQIEEFSEIKENDNIGDGQASFGLRENLKETVFFYPDLITKDGEVEINFTMGESLTKWKFRLFAHTSDLEYVFDSKEIITQKELMIEPHLPRFVRQGDEIFLNAKVTNLSGKDIDAKLVIQLNDGLTLNDISAELVLPEIIEQRINISAGESKNVEWKLSIPEEFNSLLEVKMMASSEIHSDGEVNILPVLSNRMLVTEAKPFHIQSNAEALFTFKALNKMSQSESIINHKFSIELSSNPSWIVLKSLPFLLDKNSNSSNEILDNYFATKLGVDLIGKNEDIRKQLRIWSTTDVQSSSLSSNQDLKLNDLNETPWIQDALAEERNMKTISLLLDDNYVMSSLTTLIQTLSQRQQSNGGFSWHPGGRDNWYITQYVLEGFGKLKSLGIEMDNPESILISNAVQYIDERFLEYYKENKKLDKSSLDPKVVHYLYVRSLFMEVPFENDVYPAFRYYTSQSQNSWQKSNSYLQSILAIGLNRWNYKETSILIFESLKERMIEDKEIGNYWNDQAGYYWFNPKVEKQSSMIELFRVMGSNQSHIDGLKLWLLKNKQVNSWSTSRATASAVYAFLIDAGNWLSDSEMVEVLLPKRAVQIEFSQSEKSTGYMRKDWNKDSIDLNLSEIKISNPNDHVSWGAAYWQYFEDLDKIESYDDNPLVIHKKLMKVVEDENGEQLSEINNNSPIEPGDRLRVRIELHVDRPMEFVEMKDLRSSGLEPTNVLSQYKYKDGLAYYESTKDQASYFYFDALPKGNFVFEYDLLANHKGQFSNGICSIQSYYAPEFGSHSKGISLSIENN